ncbi:MAG: FtsW/RodA/SpoVE family cell cycle protein [Phycisphaerales bacterium]|nr:FtsW/RodA/SpoVE family cell cycle protein [Phycisphaerales bacterium]
MLRPGSAIVLCALALLCIGVIAVNSAGLSVGTGTGVTLQSILLSRTTGLMLAAMVALLATSLLPVDRLVSRPDLGRWALGLYLLTVAVIALPYIPGIAHEAKGSARWVTLPLLGTMQPSELAKWGVLLLLAWYGARHASTMHHFRRGVLTPLLLVGVLVAIIGYQDLGTAVLIAGVATLMLVAAGARVAHFLPAVPAAAGLAALAFISAPYRVRRVTAFLDPYSDPRNEGYHLIQSLVAIANGEGHGRGIGFGLQKFGYLPEDRTDFVFAVICEEAGIAGAAVVVSLYIALIWSGWRIVRAQPHPALRLLGLGIIATLGSQAIMNLMVVTGMVPTKGIALPLLSSGGTGWIVTGAALGLLVAMDHATADDAEAEATLPVAAGVETG